MPIFLSLLSFISSTYFTSRRKCTLCLQEHASIVSLLSVSQHSREKSSRVLLKTTYWLVHSVHTCRTISFSPSHGLVLLATLWMKFFSIRSYTMLLQAFVISQGRCLCIFQLPPPPPSSSRHHRHLHRFPVSLVYCVLKELNSSKCDPRWLHSVCLGALFLQ